MRIRCVRHLSSTGLAAIALAWSPQAVHAQDSVENFIDLAPTDFGYINQATRDRMNDEALHTGTNTMRSDGVSTP